MFKEEETQYCPMCQEWAEKYDQLKKENEKMSKGYEELTEIVSPYIDDFTGYNEEQCGFDIILCVRELMQQLDQLKEEVEKQRALKQTYLACYKTKHGDVKGKLFKYETYKQALLEIKGILEQYLDGDKRIDKEADVDVYLMAMHRWLNKVEHIK